MPRKSIERTLSALPAKAVLLVALSVGAALAVSGPAEAQHTKKPSKLVHLRVVTTVNGGLKSFIWQSPDGNNDPFGTVPPGQVLVVTSATISVDEAPNPGAFDLSLASTKDGNTVYRTQWVIPCCGQITHLTFPSGLVFESGSSIESSTSGGISGLVRIGLTGYLAPDV